MRREGVEQEVDRGFEGDPPSYSLFLVNEHYNEVVLGRMGGKGEKEGYGGEMKNLEYNGTKDGHLKDEKVEFNELKDKKIEGNGLKNKERGQKESGKKEIGQDWRQFTSQTTLHGLKYVFDSRPLRIRGLVWLTCVVGCLGLFAYQAIERTLIYFQYPSNVNVEIVYVPSLEFPAVTVCNYNKHRLSAVVERNMYEFMSQISKGKNDGLEELLPAASSVLDVGLNHLNLTEFMLSTAHQVTDFIVGCKWRMQDCDTARNFSVMFTDLGVCYSFNADVMKRLAVTKSGSRSGLSIMLNVEQYEYMNGPDHESGIKILLHDPREVPQVRDLGFAVSPGTYALVGVRRQVVENLPSPYGVCYTNVSLRSECLAECVSADIFKRCGCRDYNMKPPKNHEDNVCSFGSSFFCVRESLVFTSKLTTSQCSCPAPCSKVTYDPVLSYAQISQLDFKQVADRDVSLDVSRIKENYEKARSINERVDRLNREQNEEMIEGFLNSLSNFKASISSSIRAFNPYDNYFYQHFNVNTPYARNFTSISEDLHAVNMSFSLKIPFFSTPQPDISNWITTINDVYVGIAAFLDINLQSNSSSLVRKLASCSEMDDSAENLKCVDDDPNTPTYLYYKRHILDKWLQYADLTLEWLETMDSDYARTTRLLFENTDFQYETVEDHLACVSTLSAIKSFWRPLMHDLIHIHRPLYLSSKDIAAKLQAAKAFETFYRLSKGPQQINRGTVKPCHWFVKDKWVDESYTSFENSVNNAFHVFPVVTSLENSIYLQTQQILSVLQESTDSLVKSLEDFMSLEGNLTKKTLAKIFESNEAQSIEVLITVQLRSCMNEFNQLENKIFDLHNNLKNAYNKSFHLVVPSVNDQLIGRLRLTKTCQKMVEEQKDPHLERLLSSLTTKRCQSVVGLVCRVFERYKYAVQKLHNNAIRSSKEFDSSLELLKNNLKEYVRMGALDHNFIRENFIKVDIFYKDLSYDRVQQQVSFQSLSLFSEIGGFLGLLLGASVLTLVEFVDFFIMMCLGYAKKKKEV